MKNILLRLVEKVERANNLQHSGTRIPKEDWAELFALTNEARAALQAPPTSMNHLMAAYDGFRAEADDHKVKDDMEAHKAALEDAAAVADVMTAIDNGTIRGKYDDARLAEIEKTPADKI